MPQWVIQGSAIAGRVQAGLLGCVCFYLAFFLYEDEEGKLQNRIDDLWISVHDRARLTDTVSTALFNRIAQILTRLFSRIFGERRFSLQMLSVSTNLSLAGTAFVVLCGTLLYPDDYTFAADVIECLISFTVLGGMALLAMRFRRKLVAVLTLFPFWILFVVALLVLLKSANSQSNSVDDMWGSIMTSGFLDLVETLPFILIVSLVSDAIAVVVIRRLFVSISQSLSVGQILRMIVALAALFMAILPGPYFILEFMDKKIHAHNIRNFLDAGSDLVLGLNTTTSLYCLIPFMMLIGLLVHRLIWPFLARVIYAVSRNYILVNRKALSGFGCLGLTIAFNL